MESPALEKTCKDVLCEKKGNPQPLSAFPINRRIQDGRHRYCRQCCLRRVHQARADRKEREKKKKGIGAAVPLPVWYPQIKSRLTDRDARVLEAIQRGARTQREIKSKSGLDSIDQVGLSLAELMINRGLVRTSRDLRGDRIYLPTERMAQVA